MKGERLDSQWGHPAYRILRMGRHAKRQQSKDRAVAKLDLLDALPIQRQNLDTFLQRRTLAVYQKMLLQFQKALFHCAVNLQCSVLHFSKKELQRVGRQRLITYSHS